MIERAIIAALFCAVGWLFGWAAKSCPKPPDPKEVIHEVEVIRWRDRKVRVEVEKIVQQIVERPFYTGACLDDDGLHSLNRLIQGTAAGSANPRIAAPDYNPGHQPSVDAPVVSTSDQPVRPVSSGQE